MNNMKIKQYTEFHGLREIYTESDGSNIRSGIYYPGKLDDNDQYVRFNYSSRSDDFISAADSLWTEAIYDAHESYLRDQNS